MGRIWTIEARLKQVERIRNQKPWLKSTGPRTVSGKRASSSNSYKHGSYTTEMKQIFRYLRLQKNYIATLRFLAKQENLICLDDYSIFENELNKSPTKSMQNDTKCVVKNIVKRGVFTLKILKPHNDNHQEKTRHIFWGRVFRNFISDKEIIQRLLFS